jgi:hypothetical protein
LEVVKHAHRRLSSKLTKRTRKSGTSPAAKKGAITRFQTWDFLIPSGISTYSSRKYAAKLARGKTRKKSPNRWPSGTKEQLQGILRKVQCRDESKKEQAKTDPGRAASTGNQ